VPPGKEGKIELAVEHTDGYQGEIAKPASVVTNDPKFTTFNLILRARFKVEMPPGSKTPAISPPGKTIGPFVLEPADRWSASVVTGSIAQNRIYLINNDPKPFHIKKLEMGGTDFVATMSPIQDGRRYEIILSTSPSLKPGEYHQKMQILTDNPAAPEVPVQLDLTVVPRVMAIPTSIIMPPLPINVDLASINWPTIDVRKVQSGGLKIKSYTTTLPFLKLELLTQKEGEFYRIRLTIDNSKVKPGEFKGKVRIETNDANVPVIEVPIQGHFSSN